MGETRIGEIVGCQASTTTSYRRSSLHKLIQRTSVAWGSNKQWRSFRKYSENQQHVSSTSDESSATEPDVPLSFGYAFPTLFVQQEDLLPLLSPYSISDREEDALLSVHAQRGKKISRKKKRKKKNNSRWGDGRHYPEAQKSDEVFDEREFEEADAREDNIVAAVLPEWFKSIATLAVEKSEAVVDEREVEEVDTREEDIGQREVPVAAVLPEWFKSIATPLAEVNTCSEVVADVNTCSEVEKNEQEFDERDVEEADTEVAVTSVLPEWIKSVAVGLPPIYPNTKKMQDLEPTSFYDSSKAQELREKCNSIIEKWNKQQEQRSSRNFRYSKEPISCQPIHMSVSKDPVSVKGASTYKKKIEKLVKKVRQVESKLQIKKTVIEVNTGESSRRGLKERAELRLRLSQLKTARIYYEDRLFQIETKTFPEFYTPPEPINVTKILDSLQISRSFDQDEQTIRNDNDDPTLEGDQLQSLPPLDQFDTLQEELDYEAAVLNEQYPIGMQKFRSQMHGGHLEGISKQSLQVGSKAPSFRLLAQSGKMVNSSKFKGPLIVTFFHGGWSSLCRITLQGLQSMLKSFEEAGAKLVAISPQKQQIEGLSFPLLVDESNLVAEQFHVKYPMNICLPGQTTAWPLPMPATFVIVDGTIIYSFCDCDPTRRAEPRAILEALPPPVKRRRSSVRDIFQGCFPSRTTKQ